MSLPNRVSLITLGSTDVERSAAFYEALGWKRSSASVKNEVAFFQLIDSALGIWSYQALAKEAGLDPADPLSYRGFSCSINMGSEVEVDQVLNAATTAGATITRPAFRADWGGYTGYFKDLDGNLWEIAHNPDWVLDADGSLRLPA